MDVVPPMFLAWKRKLHDSEQVDLVELTEDIPVVDYAAKKRSIVMRLIGYSAFLGFVSSVLSEDYLPLLEIAFVPYFCLVVSWCFADAAQRGRPMGWYMRKFLIFAFSLGLPFYLFRSRGIRAIVTFVFATLLVVIMFVAAIAANLATLYFGEAAGLWEIDY